MSNDFQSFVSQTQVRNKKQLRFSLLIAALLALLVWKTTWLALKPGLLLLLAGQLALAVFLMSRNRQLVESVRSERWFSREASAQRYATLIESGSRTVGFLLLAYGFWQSTRNLVVALALGLLYPVVIYWGLTRVTIRQAARRLQAEQQRLEHYQQEHPGPALR